MTRIRLMIAIAAAGLLLTPPRVVQAQDPKPPLNPGHSAGVQEAQQTHTGLALVGTAAIIAVVIVVATTTSNGSGNNDQPNPPAAPATTAP